MPRDPFARRRGSSVDDVFRRRERRVRLSSSSPRAPGPPAPPVRLPRRRFTEGVVPVASALGSALLFIVVLPYLSNRLTRDEPAPATSLPTFDFDDFVDVSPTVPDLPTVTPLVGDGEILLEQRENDGDLEVAGEPGTGEHHRVAQTFHVPSPDLAVGSISVWFTAADRAPPRVTLLEIPFGFGPERGTRVWTTTIPLDRIVGMGFVEVDVEPDVPVRVDRLYALVVAPSVPAARFSVGRYATSNRYPEGELYVDDGTRWAFEPLDLTFNVTFDEL